MAPLLKCHRWSYGHFTGLGHSIKQFSERIAALVYLIPRAVMTSASQPNQNSTKMVQKMRPMIPSINPVSAIPRPPSVTRDRAIAFRAAAPNIVASRLKTKMA